MPRILFLDYARGFTVLIMPSVHVVMLYSNLEVQQSLLRVILQFLAEGPGAQLFMLIMGVSFTLSKKITGQQVFQRTILLFIGGLALNFFKFVIPLELELLPNQLLRDYPLTETQFLLMGDIFHFAAFAYPLTYLISRLKYYRTTALLLATAIMLLSPLVWDVKTGNIFVDQLLVYYNGEPPLAFFPVFPWLVYPLVGLAIGQSIQSGKLGIIGAIVTIGSLLFPATTNYVSHYRTPAADTLFHLGIVLLWLALFNWLSQKLKDNFVFSLLSFCSKQISFIYITQWLLIFWCIPIAGYQSLDLIHTFYWMIAITATTLLCSYAWKKNL